MSDQLRVRSVLNWKIKNCWRGNPDERPMLGEVDDELKVIMKSELRKNQQEAPTQLPRQSVDQKTQRQPANRQG